MHYSYINHIYTRCLKNSNAAVSAAIKAVQRVIKTQVLTVESVGNVV